MDNRRDPQVLIDALETLVAQKPTRKPKIGYETDGDYWTGEIDGNVSRSWHVGEVAEKALNEFWGKNERT